MKTDLYTKVILTVIALALTINLVKDITFTTPAYAAPAPIPLPAPAASQADGVLDVNIVQINGTEIATVYTRNSNKDALLPVSIYE